MARDRDLGGHGGDAEAVDLGGRHGAEDFIVVAAGERGFKRGGVGGDDGLRGVGQRHARGVDSGGNAGDAAELGEIADKTVRHIHGGGSIIAEWFRPAHCAAAAADSATADDRAARR